jgi:hypothetical protein
MHVFRVCRLPEMGLTQLACNSAAYAYLHFLFMLRTGIRWEELLGTWLWQRHDLLAQAA